MIAREGLLRLIETFDRLEIPYMLVGSTVSSVYGFYRATADVDVVVDLSTETVEQFVELLKDEFYVDAGQIATGLKFRRSFNVIHLATAYKFDLFPLKRDAYSVVQFSRRRHEGTSIFGDDPIELSLCTPEDIILNKILWYNLGGRVSDRQWNDILGVVTIKRDVLDFGYLRKWAVDLAIEDLLESALAERKVN